MYVSGLTILRNAVRLGYCFEESIRSALPLCDEFVVVVGDSDDARWKAGTTAGSACRVSAIRATGCRAAT